MPPAIIGRAGEGCAYSSIAATSPIATLAGGKFGAAPTVDPDAVIVPTPGLPLRTWGATALASHLDATAGIGVAIIPPSVVRGAIDGLTGVSATPVTSTSAAPVAAVATLADDEVGTASAIDPYASTVPSPGLTLRTRGAAALVSHLDSAARVCAAVVSFSIVGGTSECLTNSATTCVSASAGDEISATSSIDPYASAVPSPGLTLCAGRAAALASHLYSTSCIDVAVVPLSVIRGAGNGLSAAVAGLSVYVLRGGKEERTCKE